MIDDEDVDFAILLWPSSGPWWLAVIGLIVISGLAYAAYSNSDECSKRTCHTGEVARLLDHECVCVSEPQ